MAFHGYFEGKGSAGGEEKPRHVVLSDWIKGLFGVCGDVDEHHELSMWLCEMADKLNDVREKPQPDAPTRALTFLMSALLPVLIAKLHDVAEECEGLRKRVEVLERRLKCTLS